MLKSSLLYGGGDVFLKTSGKPVVIEINYRGDASFHTNLGRNWLFQSNKNKIIIYNYKNLNFKNELIFKYRGEFIPSGCKLIDIEKSQSLCFIKKTNVHFWQLMNYNWETSDKYTKYKNTYKFRNPIKGVRNG